MKKKVLLICPHEAIEVFAASKIRVAIPLVPYISLGSLAGSLLRDGVDAHILDLSVYDNPDAVLERALRDFSPDFVGITFTTALASAADEVARKVRAMHPSAVLIAGGVHATTLPEDVLKNTVFDIVCIGEGEETIREIAAGKSPRDILGIGYKEDGEIKINPRRPLIEDLDDLPLPAWHLYDLKKYSTPRINARKNPVGAMETSRGCVFGCIFCNKTVFQRRFRAKSPERVVDEMEYMLKCGFREIHLWDDGFSTDLNRAKEICRLILRRGLEFPWNIYNGLRVDRLDEELLRLLKSAGCYRISIGVESGNQEVLNDVDKNITPEQIRRAAKMIKTAGIESLGFFLVGFPKDTESSMRETIDFAKELNLDLPKVGIIMPLPGTPLFDRWQSEGRILSYEWSKYIFHADKSSVYRHPSLPYETIRNYYDKFYRELYFSPKFIWKRFIRGLKT
ncbi:MAG: radical SAM protein, partial [Patescibacteria group bacterium]